MFFVLYDGDNIGKMFERLYLADDLARLKLLSKTIQEIHLEIKECCDLLESRLIESGGDEGLLECETRPAAGEMSKAIEVYWARCGMTVSVGIGATPREAYLKCQQIKKVRAAT